MTTWLLLTMAVSVTCLVLLFIQTLAVRKPRVKEERTFYVQIIFILFFITCILVIVDGLIEFFDFTLFVWRHK
jgi:hypothetical protein